MDEKVFDVIVVGSGPAGLSAAIYTTRGAASTLIFGGEKWGGQLMLTTKVENFPGFPDGIMGPDLMANMRKQAERLGAKFLENTVKSIDITQKPFAVAGSDNKIYYSKSVILAMGALTQWLNVPGEKELIGRGVSTCAPCDAPFFKNKRVAVVGGGDSAMEEASVLTRYAQEVVIIHRRDVFKASEIMQKKVMVNPKVKILWNTEVVKIGGKERVDSLEIKNNKTGEIASERFDGVFVAIGHKPDSDIVKGTIELDEKGFVKITGGHSETSVSGIFVAGDVMDAYYKQAITAAGSGCAAALDTMAYLSENTYL